jgi:hypothetical protein
MTYRRVRNLQAMICAVTWAVFGAVTIGWLAIVPLAGVGALSVHLAHLLIYGRRQVRFLSFDVVQARRESHAMGLPFPEADGTLSHPRPIGWHVGACRCVSAYTPSGTTILTEDSRCQDLRHRSTGGTVES